MIRALRRSLRQEDIRSREAQDVAIQHVLGQAMARALQDLAHRPPHMSLQGWLNVQTRQVLHDELHSHEPDLGRTA